MKSELADIILSPGQKLAAAIRDGGEGPAPCLVPVPTTMPEPPAHARPSEIYVVGTRFGIKWEPAYERWWGYGYSRPHDAVIMLAADISPEVAREVLMHEIIHSIDALTMEPSIYESLRQPGTRQNDLMIRLMEPQVLAFSRGLFMTLTDPRNAAAMRWMLCVAKETK